MTKLANRVSLLWLVCLAGCATGAGETTSAPAGGKPSTFMTNADLGPVIRAALGGDWEANYFDAAFDLNGDGAEEIIAYVAGPMVCGTGGCTVYVFSPGTAGYDLVGRITLSHPPIRVSEHSTNGWRNLIVRVAGGGIVQSFDSELAWDGTSYTGNPTTPPAEKFTTLKGARVLIPTFESFRDGKPVPPPES